VSVALASYNLLLLNGSVFGISGFIHGCYRGTVESAFSVGGLILSGAAIGALRTTVPPSMLSGVDSLPIIATSGFLVGLGTKLSNGCTSGHMLCGLSRLSLRSVAATLTFMLTGSITATLIHGESTSPSGPLDWSLGDFANTFAVAQASLFLTSLYLYKTKPEPRTNSDGNLEILPTHRRFASFLTAVQFGLGLHLTSSTVPGRVIRFLLTPFHSGFDPTLVFLALGALPVGTVAYYYGRGEEKPQLGGKWCIPKCGKIDSRLLVGAGIFGIGWGIQGICPGPALVNLGIAAFQRHTTFWPLAGWLISFVFGGVLAEKISL
jgi:uncharacterized membrane protein YedE/YeeE